MICNSFKFQTCLKSIKKNILTKSGVSFLMLFILDSKHIQTFEYSRHNNNDDCGKAN